MENLNRRSLILLFTANSLLFFFQGLTKFIYVPLVTPVQTSYNVGAGEAGLLITLVFLGYGLARFPSGLLADSLGCPRVIAASGLIMGFALLLVGLAPGFFWLAVFSFLMGASTGLYVTAGYNYAVILGQASFETVSTALLELFGNTANLLAPLLVVLFWENLGLELSSIFLIMAGGVFLAAVIFIGLAEASGISTGFIKLKNLLFKNRSPENRERNNSENALTGKAGRQKLKEIRTGMKEAVLTLKEPELRNFIIWATLVGGFGAFAIQGFESFIPSLLYEFQGYSFSRANQLFVIVTVSGLLTKILVAWSADRFGSKRMLALFYLISLVIFFYFTRELNHVGVIVSLVLLGVVFRSHNTIINSYVLKMMPEASRGSGFGLFSTLYTAIYSLGAVFSGSIADRTSLVTGMRFAVIGIVIAALFLLVYNKMTAITEKK